MDSQKYLLLQVLRSCFMVSMLLDLSSAVQQASVVQKTQNLAIGACAAYDEEFCSREVENSVCNKEKNECFCRKGYVAIRENGRVTCKTLLTDLKCRTDRDCVHVNRSSCHPGAGYCSCPGSTIYVPQQHACRSRADHARDSICKVCQEAGGVCFYYEPNELDAEEVRHNPNLIGCVCPGQGKFTRIRSPSWAEHICSGELVGIGEKCDQYAFICRSKNAICNELRFNQRSQIDSASNTAPVFSNQASVHISVDQVSLCQCPAGTIPVYQSTLDYFECFPKLAHNAPRCEPCTRDGGQCYDLNADGESDGCVCPHHRSHGSEFLGHIGHHCPQLHVLVNCSNGYLSVCYRPHSEVPYHQLQENLLQGNAVAKLGNIHTANSKFQDVKQYAYNPSEHQAYAFSFSELESNSGSLLSQKSLASESSACILLESTAQKLGRQFLVARLPELFLHESALGLRHFCAHLKVWGQQHTCGTRVYSLGSNLLQYEAMLEVMVNHSFRTPSLDLRVPLRCTSQKPAKPILTTMGTKDKIHLSTAQYDVLSQKTILEFRILNYERKEVYLVDQRAKLRLDALLTDSTETFKAMNVYSCSFGNRSKVIGFRHEMGNTKFIHHGCPVKNPWLHTRFSNGQFPSRHIQSDEFPSFKMGNGSSIFFRCVFKLCANPVDCQQQTCEGNVRTLRRTVSRHSHSVFLDNTSPNAPRYAVNDSVRPDLSQYSSPRFKTITLERWAHVEVQTKQCVLPSCAIVKTQKEEEPVTHCYHYSAPSLLPKQGYPKCQYTVCLTAADLMWVIIGFIFITSLICLSVFVALRHPRLTENPLSVNANSSSTLLNGNLFSSKVKRMGTCMNADSGCCRDDLEKQDRFYDKHSGAAAELGDLRSNFDVNIPKLQSFVLDGYFHAKQSISTNPQTYPKRCKNIMDQAASKLQVREEDSPCLSPCYCDSLGCRTTSMKSSSRTHAPQNALCKQKNVTCIGLQQPCSAEMINGCKPSVADIKVKEDTFCTTFVNQCMSPKTSPEENRKVLQNHLFALSPRFVTGYPQQSSRSTKSTAPCDFTVLNNSSAAERAVRTMHINS
ncbi:unnamed protein product [Dicrocoelium dendriticum]|nr:unnamed protein product [Dicrocoelium dendriticum]